MADSQNNGLQKRRRTLVGVAIAVTVAVVPGLLIVLRNAQKVTTGPVPFSLKQVPPDTTVKYSVKRMRPKVVRLERRLARHRRAAGTLSEAQATLGFAADTALARASVLIDAADACAEPGRKRTLRDSARVQYDAAKEAVRVFTSSLGRPELDADSLDDELRVILSD